MTEEQEKYLEEFREKSVQEWITSNTISDEFITEQSSNILTNPTYVIRQVGKKKPVEPLYSKKQMMEMFRAGFVSMAKTKEGKKVLKKRNVSIPSPETMLRNMDKDTSITVPFVYWDQVRTAASKLKKDFGCVYKTRKQGEPGEVGVIVVTRIS